MKYALPLSALGTVIGAALAAWFGYWLDGPVPYPHLNSEIAAVVVGIGVVIGATTYRVGRRLVGALPWARLPLALASSGLTYVLCSLALGIMISRMSADTDSLLVQEGYIRDVDEIGYLSTLLSVLVSLAFGAGLAQSRRGPRTAPS